jgi:hypothetical protein
MLKYTLVFLLLLIGLRVGQAGTTTVVLQNGLNGYSGCEDNYISRDIYTPHPDTIPYLFFTCG